MTLSQPTVYVGLAVASADDTQVTTGVADNVAVTVPAANQVPAVSLTAPANGATFTAPATMTVSATASDSDGVARHGRVLRGADVDRDRQHQPLQRDLEQRARGQLSGHGGRER